MRVVAKIDADKATDEFKAARRDLNQRTKSGLIRAGERVALPEAKRRAAGLRVQGRSVAGSLVVRSTSRTAYLASNLRGKPNRAVGLLEFGGTVKTPIFAKRGSAIRTPWGPRASVKGPRHYKGRKFLTGAVQSRERQITEAIKDEVMKSFDGFEVRG